MDAQLETLLTLLDRLQGQTASRTGETPDAIDRILAKPPRTTAVVSVRESPEMEAFRRELADGLIRADTVRNLLVLINTVLTRLL